MNASKSHSDSESPRWILFIAYVILLFVASVLPPEQIPKMVMRANDKGLHGFTFFLLTLLAFRTFFYSLRTFFSLHAPQKAAGFSLLYGAFLEMSQLFSPGRDASFADWLADAIGVLLAAGILRMTQFTSLILPFRNARVTPLKTL